MYEWQTIGVTALPPGTAAVEVGEYKTRRPVVALLHQRHDTGDGSRVYDRVVLGYLNYSGEVLPVTELAQGRQPIRADLAVSVIPAPAGLTARYGNTSVPVVALRVRHDGIDCEVTALALHEDGSLGWASSPAVISSTWTDS